MAQKVLVVLPGDLPGIVLSEPALRALKGSLPNCHLTVVVSRRWEPLARHCPHADAVVAASMRSPWFFLYPRRCRTYRGILFETTLGGALGLALAGTPRRMGFRCWGVSWLLNRQVKAMPRQLRSVRVRHFVELMRYFGCEVEDRIPRWDLPKSEGSEDVLVTWGEAGRLSAKIIGHWREAGFTPLDESQGIEFVMAALGRARRVVGPPDSAVTLAEAMGIPTLRLMGKRPRRDECPGLESALVAAKTSPQEALAPWSLSKKPVEA